MVWEVVTVVLVAIWQSRITRRSLPIVTSGSPKRDALTVVAISPIGLVRFLVAHLHQQGMACYIKHQTDAWRSSKITWHRKREAQGRSGRGAIPPGSRWDCWFFGKQGEEGQHHAPCPAVHLMVRDEQNRPSCPGRLLFVG